MPGVVVLCWEENRPWVSMLRQKGVSVPWVEQPKGDAYLQIPEIEPEVLLVDLTRSPDSGREIVLELADDLPGVPVVLVSESARADKGLRSKIKTIITAKPGEIVDVVTSALVGDSA